MAVLFDVVDGVDPLEPEYCPILRASSEEVEARVEEDVALVPELSEGAESEDEDAEWETPVLVSELLELEVVAPPARGADTLLVAGAEPTGAEWPAEVS